MTTRRRRIFLFAAVCVVALALPIVYIGYERHSARPAVSRNGSYTVLERINPGDSGVLFRSTVPDESFGKVAFVPHEQIGGPWAVSNLSCDRVYFQRGHGVCEAIESSYLPPYVLFMFDDKLQPGTKRPLAGVPNRARVSPDGRRAAITAFVTGHSYAEGGFSTATTIHDAVTGEALDNLEAFHVIRDGEPFDAVDFNFWGVTFTADGNTFYATLRTANVNYLIHGDVDRREARVLREGVECPSLSPDGRRLAFKQRVSGSATVFWRVAVLNLETMTETVLDAEQRSVDDQVEWLDNTHVIYHLPVSEGADIWSLRTDQPEAPQLLIKGGYSPAVLR
jgi:WD40-like Beta Propeller Repeat